MAEIQAEDLTGKVSVDARLSVGDRHEGGAPPANVAERAADGTGSAATLRGAPREGYRVLAYRGTTNLGDAVQTAAISRLLGGPLTGVYRRALGGASVAAGGRRFVVNGWLGDAPPAADSGGCLFAGVFLGRRVPEQLNWLRTSSAPVGARDPVTQALLRCAGVKCELVGCATLTLGRYDGPRAGRYSVDLAVPGTTSLSNTLSKDVSWAAQWDMALVRLDQLRTAEIVYTSRLHVALPCLAFGTPVVVPRHVRGAVFQPARLSLLDALGFAFDRPCTLDVEPWATRYVAFLSTHLGHPVRPGPFRFPRALDVAAPRE